MVEQHGVNMQHSLPRQVRPKSDVLFQHLGRESVLLNLYTEQYYSLDQVGTRMWECFNVDENVEAAIERLLVIYNVEEDKLRHDLAVLINELSAVKLITTESV